MSKASKPAPAQPPKAAAKPAPTKAPEPEEDEIDVEEEPEEGDDGDDDTEGEGDGEAKKGRNWMKTQRLAPPKRESVLLLNLVGKVQRRADVVKNWPGEEAAKAKAALEATMTSLREASALFAGLPDSYKARTGTTTSKGVELEAGSLVRITDKRTSDYEGTLEPEEMTGLKVKEVRGNKVVVTTRTGIVMIIARGHVCPDVVG